MWTTPTRIKTFVWLKPTELEEHQPTSDWAQQRITVKPEDSAQSTLLDDSAHGIHPFSPGLDSSSRTWRSSITWGTIYLWSTFKPKWFTDETMRQSDWWAQFNRSQRIEEQRLKKRGVFIQCSVFVLHHSAPNPPLHHKLGSRDEDSVQLSESPLNMLCLLPTA